MKLLHGDCLEQMKTLPDNSIDAIVSDPPYGISFMAKKWDYDVPKVDVWQEAMRVLKPGGHALIACGTRTQHRMVVNIEDAGFEIRDVVSWIYGSGFPKSLNVSKAIDKMDASDAQQARRYKFTEWVRSQGVQASDINASTETAMGSHYTTQASQPAIMTREHLEACRHLFADVPQWVEDECDKRSVESENFKRREVVGVRKQRANNANTSNAAMNASAGEVEQITAPATEAAKQWGGWGTALKPACEFFTLARKPLSEKTVAANVLKWGTGGINVDGCRVGTGDGQDRSRPPRTPNAILGGGKGASITASEHNAQGRFPANLIHDGSDEVLAGFPETKPSKSGGITSRTGNGAEYGMGTAPRTGHDDQGSAARFFYCAKASKKDRNEGCDELEKGNNHATVKPTALMAYLCRLITPTGGTVLDPFMGSGSTGKAAVREGFDFVGCELDADYYAIATARIEAEQNREPEEPDQKELF